MANRKLGNLGNFGNLRNIIPSFLISKFSILPYSQNRKIEFKNLGKKFPSFPSFRPGQVNHLRYQHSKLFAVFPEKDPSQMNFQHFNMI